MNKKRNHNKKEKSMEVKENRQLNKIRKTIYKQNEIFKQEIEKITNHYFLN